MSENGQSSIVRRISNKRDKLFVVPKRSPGIELFSATKMNDISKEMNDQISKTFGDQDEKVRKFI